MVVLAEISGGGSFGSPSRAGECSLLLAQTAVRSGSSRALIASGLLIALVVILGLIILHMRRRLLAGEQGEAGPVMLLDDLRAMRRRGEISEQEFEHMKKRLAAKLSGTLGVSARGGQQQRGAPQAHRTVAADNAIASDKAAKEKPPPGYDLTGDKLPEPHDGG